MPVFCVVENSRQKEIYHAYISGNMTQWATVVKDMENDATIKTVDQKLELIGYYYGLTAYYIGRGNEKMARKIILKADTQLDKLLRIAPKNATLYAFKCSFTGYKISLDKYKVVTLGHESLKYINEAYLLDPSDIQNTYR